MSRKGSSNEGSVPEERRNFTLAGPRRVSSDAWDARDRQKAVTNWSFSFNPGPFNIKEHVLITIFASCGASGVYAVHIIAMLRAFYKRSIHPVAALLLALTTQVYLQFYISTTVTKHSKSFSTLIFIFCFGQFRCLVMGGLVYSEDTSWTLHTCGGQQTWFKFLYSGAHSSSKFHHFLNLKQHDAFIQSVKKKNCRALHEKEKRPKGGLTRIQFFFVVFVSSFAYYIVPGYLFPSLTALSFVCWIWKRSVTAQQIGSGLSGLGIGAIGIDWSTVSSFLGSPLATPLFAIVNTLVGFALVMYILLPIFYWNNVYEAK